MSPACDACLARRGRIDDGCARCGGSGVEPVEPDAARAVRPRVHPHATERAESVLRQRHAVLRRPDGWRGDLAHTIAEALAYERCSPIGLVMARAQVSAAEAERVVATYVDAIREHARGLERHTSPTRRAKCAPIARACAEHADRVEGYAVALADAAE